MSDNTPLLTVLLEELTKVTDWRMLGVHLKVPVYELDKIDIEHNGKVEHCKMYMLQYWLNNTMTASWSDVARALEQLNMLKLAARLKLKYLRTLPATASDDSRAEPILSRQDEVAAAHVPHTRNDVVNSKRAKKAFIVLSIVSVIVIGIAIAYQYVCITPEEAAMAELNTKPKNIVEEMQTENKVLFIKDPEQRKIIEVNQPYGVAVSKSGKVVVSSDEDHHISVYSREGNHIRTVGSKGNNTDYEEPQFHCPCGIAITSDDRILVADSKNHRIQMFNMEGSFVKSVGKYGQDPLKFSSPLGIAVHPTGRVYVADTDNHRIQVLNPDLTYFKMFGSEGTTSSKFDTPCDIAIDSSGVVYVTDHSNNRVQILSADGEFISFLGSKESQNGQLEYPNGIAIDSTNTVYVTDRKHRVSVYNGNSREFIRNFGKIGDGDREFDEPEGIAVDDTTGALYVCDSNNDRVVVY